jgi:hypothetical protein
MSVSRFSIPLNPRRHDIAFYLDPAFEAADEFGAIGRMNGKQFGNRLFILPCQYPLANDELLIQPLILAQQRAGYDGR